MRTRGGARDGGSAADALEHLEAARLAPTWHRRVEPAAR
jgi:hypothetical protein